MKVSRASSPDTLLGNYRLPDHPLYLVGIFARGVTVYSQHPTRDFTYIIGMTGYTFGVMVRSDAPWKTFPELLAAAKANPSTITYGTSGAGTSPHITMEQIAKQQGIKLVHVPFKGVAESTTALLGGHVHAIAAWAVFGTNTPGTNSGIPAGATNLLSCNSGVSSNCDGNFAFNSMGFNFLDVTETTAGIGGNILLAQLDGTVAVPGPIVGAGLPGLVVACGGLLALARRRRKIAA